MIALVHTEAPRVAVREAVARVAFAVFPVHVADRAFVRTEPGTSAAAPYEYERRVIGFFDRVLAGDG